MPKEEVLKCPFCGAPYTSIIPEGAMQLKCQYCKSTILVPPHLGGAVQRCPNHPDIYAVGLCNDCGESYCDNCLYVYNVEGGNLHICPTCYKIRLRRLDISAVLVLAVIIFFALLFSLRFPAILLVLVVGSIVIIYLWLVFEKGRKPPTVRESRETKTTQQDSY